jgi:chromate reductase
MTAPVNDRVRILGIAGSLRRLSFNKALLRAAVELAPDDVELTTFDRLREIPHYDQDLDTADAPEAATALREAIRAADALLLVTPEYNYGIPGALKNAIDWASRPPATSPLRGKPAGLMGASTGISGTMRAQLALRQCFVFTQTYALQAPEVVVPKCADRFDADLRLTDDPTREVVRTYLERLRDWARTMR